MRISHSKSFLVKVVGIGTIAFCVFFVFSRFHEVQRVLTKNTRRLLTPSGASERFNWHDPSYLEWNDYDSKRNHWKKKMKNAKSNAHGDWIVSNVPAHSKKVWKVVNGRRRLVPVKVGKHRVRVRRAPFSRLNRRKARSMYSRIEEMEKRERLVRRREISLFKQGKATRADVARHTRKLGRMRKIERRLLALLKNDKFRRNSNRMNKNRHPFKKPEILTMNDIFKIRPKKKKNLIFDKTRSAVLHPRGKSKDRNRNKLTCSCRISRTGAPGDCYVFRRRRPFCRKRKCSPSYECTSRHSGVTCFRRKISQKIVSTGYGQCTTKKVNLAMYVPYESKSS